MKGAVFLCLLGAVLVQSQYSWDGPTTGRPSSGGSSSGGSSSGGSSSGGSSSGGPSSGGPSSGSSTEGPSPSVCLTDHASCGCCLMQQQLHRMESFFNMSLNELQRDLERAENVLNDIRATRSAFSVALTNDRWCLGPFRDIVPVVYQHVFINLAGSYSIQTGKFIAPRSGVYSFSLTVYSDAGSAGNTLAACASLYHNNLLVAGPSDRNAQDQEDSSTTVMALHVNAGDEVHVKLPIGCYLCDNNSHFNTFSGFLLYATD